jgi:hypothetical protein
MYKSTFNQIILFIITTVVFFKTGSYMIKLNDIHTFTEAAIVMLCFITFILLINYASRLISKLIKSLSF